MNSLQLKKVFRLHLELDCTGADMNVLREYGKVKEAISRDILVDPDMPLAYFHYVIQSLFGWRDTKLHRFAFPSKIVQMLEENNFSDYKKLCGIYYRFPDEELDDLDFEDYDFHTDVKSYLRERYLPPYEISRNSELYMQDHALAIEVKDNDIKKEVIPEARKVADMLNFEIDDNSIAEITGYLYDFISDAMLHNLSEVRKLSEYLCQRKPYKWIEKLEEVCSDSENGFKKWFVDSTKYTELAGYLLGKYNSADDIEESDYDKISVFRKMTEDVINETQIDAIPLSNSINYMYDYKADWNVNIKLDDVLYLDTTSMTLQCITKPIDIKKENLAKLDQQGVLCFKADGLPVLENIGGIDAYCYFLEEFYAKNKDIIDFAKDQDWSTCMVKPENML